MSARYFEAPDGWDEPTIWERDPAHPDYPKPVLSRWNIARAHREHLWPLIVAAITTNHDTTGGTK